MLSPDGIKILAHYISPYKWNNHNSMQKQNRKDEYLESKPFDKDLDNE
jgi:hypothetical protein